MNVGVFMASILPTSNRRLRGNCRFPRFSDALQVHRDVVLMYVLLSSSVRDCGSDGSHPLSHGIARVDLRESRG